MEKPASQGPILPQATTGRRRLCLRVEGAVQGVGFRPFLFRLAVEMGLTGWVSNDTRGLIAEIEGTPQALEAFGQRLERERPPHAHIQRVEQKLHDHVGYAGFEIRSSEDMG